MKPIHVNKFGPIRRALISIAMFLMLLSSGAMAQKAFDRIVVFGTSLSDPGNAFALLNDPTNPFRLTQPLNVPPYDKLDEYLVPDRPYAKGGHHFTNGATWIEQFAQGQGFAGDVRPAFQSNSTKATNYAIGGTRAYVEPGNPTPTFAYQVGIFLDRFSGTPPDALYVIEMGSNDVRDALVIALKALSSGYNKDTAIQKASVHLQNALTEINKNISYLEPMTGAKKFLVLNVPDIGLVPAVKAFGEQVSFLATLLTMTFNEGLSYQLSLLSGVDIIQLDLFLKLRNFIARPGDFGFTNVDTPCVNPDQPPFICHQPDSYLFWDGIHPTKVAHAFIAQDAVQAITGSKAKP